MAYAVEDYPMINSASYMFGASFKCTTGTPMSDDLYVSRIKDGIQIVGGQKAVNAGSYTSGTNLYSLPSDMSLDFSTYTIFDTNGNPYLVFTSGNTLKLAKYTTFTGSEILVFEPRQILNAAYPGAHYTPT